VPFTQPNRFAFNASSIKANAPNASGLYGIFNTTQWIYIGEGSDIQHDLLEHLRDTGSCIKRCHPTGFTFELQPGAFRIVRQGLLIRELGTLCNNKDESKG
jgi:hypothetical protein